MTLSRLLFGGTLLIGCANPSLVEEHKIPGEVESYNKTPHERIVSLESDYRNWGQENSWVLGDDRLQALTELNCGKSYNAHLGIDEISNRIRLRYAPLTGFRVSIEEVALGDILAGSVEWDHTILVDKDADGVVDIGVIHESRIENGPWPIRTSSRYFDNPLSQHAIRQGYSVEDLTPTTELILNMRSPADTDLRKRRDYIAKKAKESLLLQRRFTDVAVRALADYEGRFSCPEL